MAGSESKRKTLKLILIKSSQRLFKSHFLFLDISSASYDNKKMNMNDLNVNLSLILSLIVLLNHRFELVLSS
jgi:hypothetical protein